MGHGSRRTRLGRTPEPDGEARAPAAAGHGLAAPLAASAGGGHHSWKTSYLAPSLVRAAAQRPNGTLPVIVQSTDGTGDAVGALDDFSDTTRKVPIVGAAAGEVVAGDLPEIAQEHNLVAPGQLAR